MTCQKRIRCTNFSYDEIYKLASLVEKYKFVIECKAIDVVSKNAKERAWTQLSKEFNSSLSTGRTSKMLKSKWDALKKQTKAELARIKNNKIDTGGEPSCTGLSKVGKIVFKLVGEGGEATSIINETVNSVNDNDSLNNNVNEFNSINEVDSDDNKEKVMDEVLAKSKLELVVLQRKILQDEHEQLMQMRQEKHDLEMKILKAQLMANLKK